MPVPLHAATVRAWLQALPQVDRLLDIAEAHCRERGLAEDALVQARLADDMWPLAKQVSEAVHHSALAIEGARAGVFRPHPEPVTSGFAGLKAEVGEAIALLGAVDPAEVESLATRPLRFEIGERSIDFVVEDFLLSFSMPNFYFHVTTVYAILRSRGLPVGKRDFLGPLRTKPKS